MKTKELYQEKIKSIGLTIDSLKQEREKLEQNKEESKEHKGIETWLNYRFESSSELTEEFSAFARDYKKYLLKQIKNDFDLVGWSRGHFFLSGFLKSKKNNRYVYFSTSDVRHFSDNWYNNILIRTAENEKDYTGGSNNFCRFAEINNKAIFSKVGELK